MQKKCLYTRQAGNGQPVKSAGRCLQASPSMDLRPRTQPRRNERRNFAAKIIRISSESAADCTYTRDSDKTTGPAAVCCTQYCVHSKLPAEGASVHVSEPRESATVRVTAGCQPPACRSCRRPPGAPSVTSTRCARPTTCHLISRPIEIEALAA